LNGWELALKVIVVTGRSIAQGRSKESKFSDEYARAAATCEVDPEDLSTLGVKPGQKVKLTTSRGSVNLFASVSSQSPHRGIVFIPFGPWANSLMDAETDGTGMPTLKGMEAEIELAAEDEVLGLKELLAKNLKERGRT